MGTSSVARPSRSATGRDARFPSMSQSARSTALRATGIIPPGAAPAHCGVMSATGTVPPGVIVVLRLAARADAETAVRGLAQSSVDAIELTLTTPDAIAVLSELRQARPDLRLFAGTVR